MKNQNTKTPGRKKIILFLTLGITATIIFCLTDCIGSKTSRNSTASEIKAQVEFAEQLEKSQKLFEEKVTKAAKEAESDPARPY